MVEPFTKRLSVRARQRSGANDPLPLTVSVRGSDADLLDRQRGDRIPEPLDADEVPTEVQWLI